MIHPRFTFAARAEIQARSGTPQESQAALTDGGTSVKILLRRADGEVHRRDARALQLQLATRQLWKRT